MIPQQRTLTEGNKIVRFVGYVGIIYMCFLAAGVFEERIYKVPYPRTDKLIKNKDTITAADTMTADSSMTTTTNSVHKTIPTKNTLTPTPTPTNNPPQLTIQQSPIPQPNTDYFTDKLTPMLITSSLACLIGYLFLTQNQLQQQLPMNSVAMLAGLDVIVHVCLVTALIRTSYVMMVMVNSCSLLAVVVIAACCTGVREDYVDGENGDGNRNRIESNNGRNNSIGQDNDRQNNNTQMIKSSTTSNSPNHNKLGRQKILICSIVCLGLFIFNLNTPSPSVTTTTTFTTTTTTSATTTAITTTTSTSFFTLFLFLLAILLQGIHPDLQAQLKQSHNPNPLLLYFHIHKLIIPIVSLLSLFTFQFSYFFTFILHHDNLLPDLTILGLLSAIGSMFVYKLIATFRQHVYPLVSTVRKCLSICLNVFWFGRTLLPLQWVGVAMVFGGIMIEVVCNYELVSKWENRNKNLGKKYRPMPEQHPECVGEVHRKHQQQGQQDNKGIKLSKYDCLTQQDDDQTVVDKQGQQVVKPQIDPNLHIGSMDIQGI